VSANPQVARNENKSGLQLILSGIGLRVRGIEGERVEEQNNQWSTARKMRKEAVLAKLDQRAGNDWRRLESDAQNVVKATPGQKCQVIFA